MALPDFAEIRELLVPAPEDWPEVRVAQEPGEPAPAAEHVGEHDARLNLRSGGEVVLERRERRALFRVPRPISPAALLHPFLAPVASVVAHWAGRETLHAAAFVVDGRAWALLGEREAGKSSTVAWLARAGVGVLSDDILVLDRGRALAGPRVVDLREEPARRLEAGEALGVIGARERWRMRLGPVPAAVPLGGWVTLGWGDRIELEPVPVPERIGFLAAQRGLRVPSPDPSLLLELAALPALALRRPQGWSSLPEAAGRLLDALRA